MSTSTVTLREKGNPGECYSDLYIMFYRHGMNANLTKGFFCSGGIQVAQKRAFEHCKIMGYKFIFVRPMVVDLQSEEEYKLKGTLPNELFP